METDTLTTMADNLMQFDNLRAVLEEFAQEFRDQYRAGLLEHDRVTRDGHQLLDSVDRNTVQAMVRSGEQAWSVTINLMDYWKYVENDTRPHWPPPGAILRWVEIKPVIPQPDGAGRIPSPRSLAYLIGRKISRFGTKGSHDFADAREATLDRFRTRIREALAKDVHDYIDRALAQR